MKLVSIGILMAFFVTINVLLSMLSGAPAWVTFLAFVFGVVAALCVAVIIGDADGVQTVKESKPIKAKAELVVETQREYKELEPGKSQSLTVVRH